jgi:hypothetical protein
VRSHEIEVHEALLNCGHISRPLPGTSSSGRCANAGNVAVAAGLRWCRSAADRLVHWRRRRWRPLRQQLDRSVERATGDFFGSRALFGGTVKANYQTGRWVFDVEGSWDWTNFASVGGNSGSSQVELPLLLIKLSRLASHRLLPDDSLFRKMQTVGVLSGMRR